VAQVSNVPSIVELVPGEQGGGIGRAVLADAEHQVRDELVPLRSGERTARDVASEDRL
jgi:hypothetical protein